MRARRARRDSEEFVEGQHARLTAFPACTNLAVESTEDQKKGESRIHTFLAFVKLGRTRMVVAYFIIIFVRLAAAFMDAFLGHSGSLREICKELFLLYAQKPSAPQGLAVPLRASEWQGDFCGGQIWVLSELSR